MWRKDRGHRRKLFWIILTAVSTRLDGNGVDHGSQSIDGRHDRKKEEELKGEISRRPSPMIGEKRHGSGSLKKARITLCSLNRGGTPIFAVLAPRFFTNPGGWGNCHLP